MALIWGEIAMNLVLTILLLVTSHNIQIFKPSLWNSSEVLKFRMYSGGDSLMNIFYNLSLQVFLGRILDLPLSDFTAARPGSPKSSTSWSARYWDQLSCRRSSPKTGREQASAKSILIR